MGSLLSSYAKIDIEWCHHQVILAISSCHHFLFQIDCFPSNLAHMTFVRSTERLLSIHGKKNGPNKICGRQPLKDLKGHGLLHADHTTWNLLKSAFHKFYLVYSWILCLIYYSQEFTENNWAEVDCEHRSGHTDKNLSCGPKCSFPFSLNRVRPASQSTSCKSSTDAFLEILEIWFKYLVCRTPLNSRVWSVMVLQKKLFFFIIIPSIYLLKVNNKNTRTRSEICWKLTIKTPELLQWRRSGVFIVIFERASHIVLVFLWTLNR